MRKRLIAVFMTICCMCACLTGCNMGFGIGDYSFYHIHISDKIESHCATVSKWYDNDNGGIEVNTKEYGSMFLSEGTYQLFENAEKCPYCVE